ENRCRSRGAEGQETGEVAQGAPHWSRDGGMPPNGSRLSRGRNARRRKAVEPQIKRLASEGTQFFPHARPAASSCLLGSHVPITGPHANWPKSRSTLGQDTRR